MTLHAPQLIVLALMLLATGIHLAKHDQPRDTKYNFVTAVISDGLMIGLLYWGGFFG